MRAELDDPFRTRLLPPQPAVLTSRQLAVFASGLVLVGVALTGAWFLWSSDLSFTPGLQKSSSPAPQPAALASGQIVACPMQPAAPAAGEKDGAFPLQADVSGLTDADIASFIVIAQDAAAEGRPRDAEVAFMMACRVADKLIGADSVESADTRYQLGALYAKLALDGGFATAANRAELLRRAELLYAGSLRAYVAKYGEGHEKSRFAAEGQAALRQALAQGKTVQPDLVPDKPAQETSAVTAPEPVTSARHASSAPSQPSASKSQSRKGEVTKATPAAPQEPGAATRPGPSFDCAKARSVSEVMICSDTELILLDRELGRLYARAKRSTADRAAFQRQSDDEWRVRESICRDRQCLLRWYAQRREQLMDDMEGSKQ
ncbi:MAG: hypothetical protein ABIQ90_00870 [Polaromonas sp.]